MLTIKGNRADVDISEVNIHWKWIGVVLC